MNFTAIDFETANALFPCEIGLSRVENGLIVETKSWLIKPACFPYMNWHHWQVHGITPSQLSDKPNFDELWSELQIYFQDTIMVAHNAMFDMAVLKSILRYYDLALPYTEYFCSINLSRKAWKNMVNGYSLGNLCNYHHVQFNHHRAGDDANACAQITLKAFEKLAVADLETGLNTAGIKLKKL